MASPGSRKRLFKEMMEVDSLNNLSSAASNVRVHGAVTSVSPVKKGKRSNFFNGKLADESCAMRMVGFNAHQQIKLQEFHVKRVPVQISNCEIKRSKYGDGYDILLKSTSGIEKSSKDINASHLIDDYTPAPEVMEVELVKIPELDPFQKVDVSVKVMEVKEVVHLVEKKKQDVQVSDHSGTTKLTLWEEHVEEMELGRSYYLQNYVVRVYQSTKYLSRGESSKLVAIQDIGGVVCGGHDDEEEIMIMKEVSVIGVPEMENFKACLKCKARVEPQKLPLYTSTIGNHLIVHHPSYL